VNDNESKPLGSDPRKKGEQPIEDDLEYFFQTKGAKLKMASRDDDDDKKEEEEEHDEDMDFEQSQNKVEYVVQESQELDPNDLEKYYRSSENYYQDNKEEEHYSSNYGPEMITMEDLVWHQKKEEIEVVDECHSYQYWKIEEQFDLELLLKEQNMA
jgi:hypothetical protein